MPTGTDDGMTTFLNSGNAAVQPKAYTKTTVLPDWYNNYTMQVLSNQRAVMDAPYLTYQGPRVAGFTPDQQAGFAATKDAAFSYQPGLNAAQGATAGLMNAPGGLETAQPYLNRAAQTSASQVQQYMNPYQDAVVNRIGELGARTLREQILPEISDRFIKSGQFGGSRQAEMIGRGIRDTMEGITAKQAEALSSGYSGALSAANTDLSRIAGLGQTAGALGAGDITSRRATAAQMGDMAARQQALGLTGAGALSTIGDKQQGQVQKNYDVAYQDWINEQADKQKRINDAAATAKTLQGGIPQGETYKGYEPQGTPAGPGPTTASNINTALATATEVFDWLKSKGYI
ncbi:MAG: hypothetical protein RI988_3503 [Pseudomonadota bacterium]|jgi:hypothetical protein